MRATSPGERLVATQHRILGGVTQVGRVRSIGVRDRRAAKPECPGTPIPYGKWQCQSPDEEDYLEPAGAPHVSVFP